jgi:hypothetical protein
MLLTWLGFVLWAGSMVDQLLMATQAQSMDFITHRVTKAIQTDLEPSQTHNALQTTIDDWSSPTLWLWFKEPDGQVMARSQQMGVKEAEFRSALMTESFPLLQPSPYRMADKHLMVSTQMVSMGDEMMGQIYVAHDLTPFYQQWRQALWGLAITSLLLIPMVIGAIAVILWRSLRPLRQVNRWATQPSVLTNPVAVPASQLQQLPQEVRGLALSFHQLATRLAQTTEQQQQLTQNISHELRTPLSLVYGYLQSLLRRGKNLTVAQREALQTAMAEAERMEVVLEDLLNQARSDLPPQPPQPERLSLNQVVAKVIQWGMNMMPSHSLEIRENLPNLEVYADQTYLTQALLDTIEWVAQRSPKSSTILITLNQTATQAIVEICVRLASNPPSNLLLDSNQKNLNPEIGIDNESNNLSNPIQSVTGFQTDKKITLIQSLLRPMGGNVHIQADAQNHCTLQIHLPKF